VILSENDIIAVERALHADPEAVFLRGNFSAPELFSWEENENHDQLEKL
jgi:hypothetical protein